MLASAAPGASFLLSPAVSPPASAASPSGADEVRTWNSNAVDTVVTAGIAVPEQPLYLTYVHRAVYDAVRAARNPEGEASVRAAVGAAPFPGLSAPFLAAAAPPHAEERT